MTTTHIDLALALAARPLAAVDPAAFLAEAAGRLAAALGVPAALVLDGDAGAVAGSDVDATHLGEAARRSGTGPLAAALRTGRVIAVPDLTRVGPPDAAAIAAQTGLLTFVAVPLAGAAGAIGLLGTLDRPVGEWLVEPAQVVGQVLAARLADLAERRRVAGMAAIEQACGMLAERRHTDVAAARAFLATYAEQSGSTLDVAARSVIDGTARPAMVPSPRTEGQSGRSPVESTTEALRVVEPRHRRGVAE